MTYLLTTTDGQGGTKRDWKSYFDFILVDAQKPLFFAEGTTLRIIDPNTGSMKLGSYAGQLQQNEVYSGGERTTIKDAFFFNPPLVQVRVKSYRN